MLEIKVLRRLLLAGFLSQRASRGGQAALNNLVCKGTEVPNRTQGPSTSRVTLEGAIVCLGTRSCVG